MTIRDVGSLDGHALSIKQLRGEDPIESMDLSGKRLTADGQMGEASLSEPFFSKLGASQLGIYCGNGGPRDAC